jgi:hypothetical protein
VAGPLFTTLMGRLCAENRRTTLPLVSAGYVANCFSTFLAKASTRPGCTGHRSITLHVILPASFGSLPSSLVLHFHNSFSELPVVEHEYCGYCVKATALPPFPFPNPSAIS